MISESSLFIYKKPIFSPECWGEHHKDDACMPNREKFASPPFLKCLKADRFSKPILQNFLSMTDKRILRAFDNGDAFDASQFPEGSVVKINYERFYLDYSRLLCLKRFNQPGHHIYNYWGVICGHDINKTRKLFISCYLTTTNLSPLLIDWLNNPVTVGEVVHEKEKNIFEKTNQVSRVNRIELYQIGKAVRKRTPERAPAVKLQLQTQH